MKRWIALGVASLCFLAFTTPPQKSSQIKEIGDEAAKQLLTTLVAQVQGAIQKGGFVYAIQFCSEEAEPLTSKVQKKLPPGVQIKRISAKNRNPNNAPDAIDTKALEFFAAHHNKKQRPESFVFTQTQTKENMVLYYKPIYTKGLCLVCHGKNIEPELQREISKKYPKDKATNYKLGDLRGVIRVTIPEKLVKPNEK